ncbi:MAG: peptidyl-prolyl cis-trans isomerase SurA [Pseudomonadota bacterium]|nr:peptidyl-prolyl cis-trans isomerase SurA [Pseudomonadota bacterium]
MNVLSKKLSIRVKSLFVMNAIIITAFIAVICSQACYASNVSQRGTYGTTSSANDTASFASESKPSQLNVPLPNANTKYYYTYESENLADNKLPITTVNKIVAFVNKSVITSNQVNDKVQETLRGFKQKGIVPPNINDIKSRALDQLIMQRIQLDLAAKSGIKVSDLEVADTINSIINQNKMNVDQFKSNLTKQGLTFDEFRKQVQIQMVIDRLKQRDVDARVTVNEDEVNRVLNSEAYKNRIDYNLSDIIISLPEQPTAEIIQQKRDLAAKAYSELKSGVPFYQVAAKYSSGPNSLNGGELGWRTNAALPPQILEALKNLKSGEYSQILQMPVGFFIFRVNQLKQHGMLQIVHQYHVRHILIKVNEIVGDEEAHQKIISIKNALDKYAKNTTTQNQQFISLAKEYSQDTSSINGGDLGWVSKGDTVPPFEKAMLSTPVGVISEPIHSPFGWHILQVLAVRDSNLTNDREKAEIRQELHENKAGMLYTQWLRDIRDMAYVKINDN